MTAGVKLLIKLAAGLVLLAVAVIAGCEARKAYFDKQVSELCEHDGVLTVYETVSVNPELYARLGGTGGAIPIYDQSSARSDEPFVSQTTTTYLRRSNPEVRREEILFIRRADRKTLAKFVYYSRVGGDFPTWAHPSAKGCPPIEGGISKRIFSINQDAK